MKGDCDFRISDLGKNPDVTYITPVVNFGEVRKAQLAKCTLLTSRWCPWDLIISFKVCSDAKERVGKRKAAGSYRIYSSLVKLYPWFHSSRWKTYLRQNCSLESCACSEGPAPWEEQSDDDDDDP